MNKKLRSGIMGKVASMNKVTPQPHWYYNTDKVRDAMVGLTYQGVLDLCFQHAANECVEPFDAAIFNVAALVTGYDFSYIQYRPVYASFEAMLHYGVASYYISYHHIVENDADDEANWIYA